MAGRGESFSPSPPKSSRWSAALKYVKSNSLGRAATLAPAPPPRQEPPPSPTAAHAQQGGLTRHGAQKRLRKISTASAASVARSTSKAAVASVRKTSADLLLERVEYFHTASGKWSQDGSVALSKSKTKLCLKNSLGEEFRFQLTGENPIRVEHTHPITRDFQVLLSGTAGRHRIAVYSESEGDEFIDSVRRLGGQVIARRSLPPIVPCSGKNLPLRPISEGQVLPSPDPESSPKMRIEPIRKSVSRRKSTGSASDLSNVVIHKHNGGGGGSGGPSSSSSSLSESPSEAIAMPPSYLPRSASLSVKGASTTAWYFDHSSNSGHEESRGLSTSNTLMKKSSDQSLNSDEQSRSSGEERCCPSSSSDDDDVFDGGRMSKGSSEPSPTWSRKESARQSRRDGHGTEEGSNERLEKYKFLLVNIEEDPNMIDPGELGMSGEFTRCDFDDYPDLSAGGTIDVHNEVDTITNISSPTKLGDGPDWIRKSFDKLDLEVAQTEHLRRSSQKKPRGENNLLSVPGSGNPSQSMNDLRCSGALGASPVLEESRKKHRRHRRKKEEVNVIGIEETSGVTQV